ncbi:hypothetical protein BKA63DRAFT_562159 [Paraphoma chrysanthemicola]|nr:hypothetical protein BKA63DRAFT_562159 [Paraphoma chrysanthemicola]
MRGIAALGLLAIAPTAYAVAFDGPAPTNINPERALVGTNPRPTEGPSVNELKKRQTGSSPETCGWVDGDFDSGVACSVGRTCMLYKSASYGMAGCCAGRNTQDCAWAYSCIGSSRYAAGSCGTSCMLDTFVRKCTNALAPYCVTWTYPGDGIADYGCDSTSALTVHTVRMSATDTAGDTTSTSLPTVAAGAVIIPTAGSTGTGSGSGTGSSTVSRKKVKKLAIGTIIGIVVAVLFLLFFVAIGVFMFIKKKKKNQQIANNAQIVANAQANRPQSQYIPPPPQQMQQPGAGGFAPPMPAQSPQPVNGYFAAPAQPEQKYGHTSVHEYALTPISNPPTPAPAYNQQYGSPVVPPMPQQQYQAPANGAFEVPANVGVSRPPPQQVVSPVQQYSSPVVGAHEVDAISVPQAPGQQPGPVYEMGQGK